MHRHAMWLGVLLAACGSGDVERALPKDQAVDKTQELRATAGSSLVRSSGRTPDFTVERKGSVRVPAAPQRASPAEVRAFQRELAKQAHSRVKHRDEHELEELLDEIVDTPPGRARARLLNEYAVDAYYLGKAGQRRALARATEVLEGRSRRPQ